VKYRIAALQPADKARWLELWGAYQEFYRTELPPEATEATWTRMHDGRIGASARVTTPANWSGSCIFCFTKIPGRPNPPATYRICLSNRRLEVTDARVSSSRPLPQPRSRQEPIPLIG
jgi:hypothetical protein